MKNNNPYNNCRGASVVAAAGNGVAKVIEASNNLAKEEPKQQKKALKIFGIVTSIIVVGVATIKIIWDKSSANRLRKEKLADAEAKAIILIEQGRQKTLNGTKEVQVTVENESMETEEDTLEESPSLTWQEYYKQSFPFQFKNLPPIISDFMEGCPEGFEEAMLAQLTTTLGATCFSRVQAEYLDGKSQRPALQTIIEGESGSGKDHFRSINDALLKRRMEIDDKSMQNYEDGKPILQTLGISVSKARFLDILANNQGVHCIAFEPEIKTVTETIKSSGSINDTLFRNAYDIAKTQRMNKDNSAPQGRFDTCFNFVFLGTPGDINSFLTKGISVEGGNASRICWCVIPPIDFGKMPTLRLPSPKTLDAIHDKMDAFIEKYCFTVSPLGYMPVELHTIDLSYVKDALKTWQETQFKASNEGMNRERALGSLRVAKTAFRCAMVFDMLCGNPTSLEKRKHIIELTIYMANYFMERYLHKFGHIQNQHHASYMDNERVSVVGDFSDNNLGKLTDPYNGRTREEVWNKERENGISATEIARKYNTTRDTVNAAVRRYRLNNGLPSLSGVA